jgi:PhnB protein
LGAGNQLTTEKGLFVAFFGIVGRPGMGEIIFGAVLLGCRFGSIPFDSKVERAERARRKDERKNKTMQFNLYLLFNGQCAEAFRFYERVLGAKVESILVAEGTRAEAQTPPEWRKKVLHGRIAVNGQTVMASDCPPERYTKPDGFSISLGYQDPGEAERIFDVLAECGQVHMPMQETFFAVRFGMVVDRFGIPWMINCEKAQIELEKMESCHAVAS